MNATLPLPIKSGDALRHAREQIGLTQAQLADAMRLTPQTISRLETGAVELSESRGAHAAAIFFILAGNVTSTSAPVQAIPTRRFAGRPLSAVKPNVTAFTYFTADGVEIEGSISHPARGCRRSRQWAATLHGAATRQYGARETIAPSARG